MIFNVQSLDRNKSGEIAFKTTASGFNNYSTFNVINFSFAQTLLLQFEKSRREAKCHFLLCPVV